MNGFERILTVLQGGVPDRIPVMTHNFLMACDEYGVTVKQYRESPEIMANTLIDACKRYDTDGILLDVDTALLAGACGAKVLFPENRAAITEHVQGRSTEEILDFIGKLSLKDDPRVQIYLETVSRLATWCNENGKFLRGNADQGAFSLACLLTGMGDFLRMLPRRKFEEELFSLLEACYGVSLQMHLLVSAAGAHCTSYGNSSEGCSVISPALFRKYGKPYDTRLAAALKERNILTVCHICGFTDPMLEDLTETGIPMYEFDDKTDIRKAKEIGSGHFALSGNIDPTLLFTENAETVAEKARELCELFRGQGGLMLGAGCAISAGTPSENIHAMVNTAKQYG